MNKFKYKNYQKLEKEIAKYDSNLTILEEKLEKASYQQEEVSNAFKKRIVLIFKEFFKNIEINAEDVEIDFAKIYQNGNNLIIENIYVHFCNGVPTDLEKYNKIIDKYNKIFTFDISNLDKIKLPLRWFEGDYKKEIRNGKKLYNQRFPEIPADEIKKIKSKLSAKELQILKKELSK